jgi:hypothetical protein
MITEDEVPLHFDRDTIIVAVSAWMTGGSQVFDDDPDAHVLGQLFALYVGTRLGDRPGDPIQARDSFVERARGQVPAASLARFASADAADLDRWYQNILGLAEEHSVDLRELRPALMSISVVIKYFASQRPAGE